MANNIDLCVPDLIGNVSLLTVQMSKVGVYSRDFARNSTEMLKFSLNLDCHASCMRVYNGDLQITLHRGD